MNPERGMTGDSCNGSERKPKLCLPFGDGSHAQACPVSCPWHCPSPDGAEFVSFLERLGEPLSIREAAALIGVSAWTVRHRYVPNGLPHFRAQRRGKLIFYKQQIIDWLLNEQRKGGMTI